MESVAHTLGKYTLLDELGRGGFGIVYKAHDPALDRFVALKVLLPQFTNDPETLKRFRQEARQASKLKHPSIVTVYEVGEVDGRYFIAMEYIDGQPLNRAIESQGKLPPAQALSIVRQVGEALDYAHQQGLLHRDVKPSNILLNTTGQALLTDFGLVKAAGEASMTTTGLAPGTPEYMAPEQILGQEADARTDLYALGVVLYQLLTGQTPFKGATPFAVLKGHAEQKPPDPRQLNPALGQYQAEVLLTALEKTPEQRFQSGAALTAALTEAVGKEEDQYWQELYGQALDRMKHSENAAALKQFQIIEQARPGFRDVTAQIEQVKAQIELERRYKRLSEIVNEARSEAQAILRENQDFPDPENILILLTKPLSQKAKADKAHIAVEPVEKTEFIRNVGTEIKKPMRRKQKMIFGIVCIILGILGLVFGIGAWYNGGAIFAVVGGIIFIVGSDLLRNKKDAIAEISPDSQE